MLGSGQTVVRGFKASLHAENRAIYLPAISAGWAVRVAHGQFENTLPFALTDLNFLDDAGLFHYPYALFSVGQNKTKDARVADDMVSRRDRSRTIILGDSGGYQVSTTPGYFSPEVTIRNLRWMEAIADYSMVLDFPTGGIGRGSMPEHVERLTAEGHDLDAVNTANRLGLDYNACLLQTKLNNDEFLRTHQPGATKFLNVLQGRSERESKFWYEAVKHYKFAGWAFAGHHQNRFSLMLGRLMDMWDDGLLVDCQWIHVLGVSTAPIAALLTAVQRQIRLYVNPNIQFSFDTSTPFQLSVYQTISTGVTLDRFGWSQQTVKLSELSQSDDHRLLSDVLEERLRKQSPKRFTLTANSAVSKLVRVGDLRDSAGLISSDGREIVTNHNVEAYIDAFEHANEAMFEGKGFYEDLSKPHPGVPVEEATIEAIIRTVFKERVNARQHIADTKSHLDALRSEV